MPSNREILYIIRVRNEARTAVRQLSADLAAQGTPVKQVARALQDAQAQASRMGSAMAQAGTGVSALAASAKKLGDAAKGVMSFAKAVGDASLKAIGFDGITKAVDGLDRVFRTSAGLGAYKARLQSLQTVLAALPAQFAAAQAAAAGLSGVAPPRPPRGNSGAGAPPNGNGPPSPAPAPAPSGGGGGGNTSNQQAFNTALGQTRASLDDMRNRLTLIAGLTVSAFGARKVLELADAYTLITSQLKLITTGTQNLTQSYEALFNISNANRTSMASTSEIYTKFAGTTKTLGVTQQSVLDVTDSVSKAVAIFGGNAQSAGAALFQFSQGLASGVLRGEELNSVMEQAPRLAQAIAAGFENMDGTIGIPLGALRTIATEGKLTTEAIFKALQRQRPVLEAEFAKTGVTIGQAFEVAKNYAIDFVGKADAATGASKKIGEAIINAVKGLKDPAAISAIQTALSDFATAVSGALGLVTKLAQNIQLVATALVVWKALSIAPMLIAMGAAAGSAAGSMAVFNVATRSMAVGATIANVAVNTLNAGLRMLGGPVGIALTVAAGALTYWLTQTKASVETSTQLSEVTEKLKGSYDSTTNSVKNLTAAEAARERLKLAGIQKSTAAQVEAESRALNKAIQPGFFESGSKDGIAKRFQPFKAEIENFRASVRAGKADFDGFRKAIALKAKDNPALGDTARELTEISEAGVKAKAGFDQASAGIKVLDKTATEAEAAVAGVVDTLTKPLPVDGNIALQQARENLKAIAAEVPALKAPEDARSSVSAATIKYQAVLRDLKVALDAGTISQDQYNTKTAEAEAILNRAKAAINGTTEAHRALADAQRELSAEGLTDRARVLEDINIKYDKQLRTLKDQRDAAEANSDQQRDLNAQIERTNQLRQQEIGNVDVKFQNGDLRDRILQMQNEARLLGLNGEARERASAHLDVESAARRAGVSDVQSMVAAYGKEYDALQKAKQARQTMGDGFNTAVNKYIEDAAKVGDESARMFGSVFANIEDGFVDVLKNGRSGFANMLDGIASDLLKFASRQLFRSLLSSVFGDGSGGTGANSAIGGSIRSAIMGAFGVKAAQTQAASAVGSGVGASVISSALGGGAGTAVKAVNSAAGSAASGVVALSDAATQATGSFGDIPYKLTSMLKGLGATDAGVAGFLGNVKAESGFNPDAINPNGGAYGLIQALGPRKRDLFNTYGSSPTADQQIAFIKKELQTTEGASLKMLQTAQTIPDGVKAGIRFERPEGYANAVAAGDLSLVNDYSKRLGYAQKFGSVGSITPTADKWSLEGATLSDDSVSKLNASFDELSTKTAGLDTSFSQVGNALDRANPQILNGVDGLTGSLTQGGSNIGQAFNQVSLDISKGGNSVLSAFESLMKGAGGGIGKILDIGSGWAGDGLDLNVGSATSWLHTGGIIGQAARVQGKAKSDLWAGAPKFHTGGIVGGLKTRERAIIAKDEEAIFPTVRMSDGNFGIRATGFTGGGGGGRGDVNFGDIVLGGQSSSGNAQQDQDHQKGMAREIKESLRALVREEFIANSRSGGMFSSLRN